MTKLYRIKNSNQENDPDYKLFINAVNNNVFSQNVLTQISNLGIDIENFEEVILLFGEYNLENAGGFQCYTSNVPILNSTHFRFEDKNFQYEIKDENNRKYLTIQRLNDVHKYKLSPKKKIFEVIRQIFDKLFR